MLMIDSYRNNCECKLSFCQLLHGLPFSTLRIFLLREKQILSAIQQIS